MTPTEGATAMPSKATPAPRRAPASTARKPIRSPSGPASGDRSAPSRTATPVTRPIAEARFGCPPWRPSTSSGRYDPLIWLARMETPKIRKIRRTAGSARTPVTARRASMRALPTGATAGRMSRDPTSSSATTEIERSEASQKTSVSGRCRPSIMQPPITGPSAKPSGPVIGGVMIDGLHLPLTDVFWLASLLSISVVALLLVGSRDIRPAVAPVGSAVMLARRAVTGVLADPAVRRIFLIFGVSILANQMSGSYLPLLVEGLHGGQPNLASAIGLVTGVAVLLGALLSPLAGPLGDRIGFRAVLAGALLGAGVALLGMAVAPSVAVLAGVVVVYSALQAATQAMVFGLVAVEVAPERRSATLNLVLLPLYVAGIIGPTVGAVAAGVGGIPAPFVVAAGVFLVGGAGVAVSLRRARAARSEPAG